VSVQDQELPQVVQESDQAKVLGLAVVQVLEQAQEKVLELAQEQVRVLGLAAALVRGLVESQPLQQ
jgi:1-aminocyclopropane-1-carboxylate deaminase/D-cysteine desulfhydrase-like pyridoxal-dependent ACC family enzyme